MDGYYEFKFSVGERTLTELCAIWMARCPAVDGGQENVDDN